MLDIYKGEWKLFLKKWLLILLFAAVCSVVAGFLLVSIVLYFDATSTYIYAGTFFMLYVTILFSLIFMGNITNTRFNLLVSFGKKRSDIAKYTIITSVALAVILWIVSVLINIFEKWLYPLVFANNVIDTDFWNFSFLYKYGLVLIVFLMCVVWFICTLMKKFGAQIIAWVYLIFGAGILIYTKFNLGEYLAGNSVASAIAGFFAGFTPVGWISLAVILSAIFIVTGYNILRRFDVKF